MFEKGDGTGRQPRKEQIDWFKHFEKTCRTSRVHGIYAEPGSGKSFIARSLQLELPNTVIVTTNNQLVDQYVADYPEMNAMKGKDYYENEIEYKESRKRALTSENVFNPLSFYYFYLREGDKLPTPQTIIVDEAHKLADMLLLTVAKSFDVRSYGIPMNLSDKEFADWALQQCKKLAPFYDPLSKGTKAKLSNQYEQLQIIADYLRDNLHEVKVFYEKKEDFRGKLKQFITIQPLTLPVGLLDTIFGSSTKIILMSGTLTGPHLQQLYPNEPNLDLYNIETRPGPDTCPIYYDPLPNMHRRNVTAIARKIRQIYRNNGNVATFVHLTYQMAPLVAKELKDLKPLLNTKDNKTEIINKFKEQGGLMIGCGMAEGVDLPGKFCEVLIIPLLLYPNRGDQAVIKKLALPEGEFWYGLETAVTMVQQLGRGVRGSNDTCKSYIIDCTFPRLFKKYSEYLTDSLRKSFIFHTGDK